MKSTSARESQSQSMREYLPQLSWQRAVPTFLLVTDVASLSFLSPKRTVDLLQALCSQEQLSKESSELLWEAIRHNRW